MRQEARLQIEKPRWATFAAIGLVVIHCSIIAWISFVNSPNLDEVGHLPSGISHWKFGHFNLYRVNPPLVRMVAVIPIMFTKAKTDWSQYTDSTPYARSEFSIGRTFVDENQFSTFWYFTLARWACLPFSAIGVWATFLWARALYGPTSGVMAAWLYTFCPNLLAWGASITPDAAASALGVLAGYTFWKWLDDPSWPRALQAGFAMGLVEITKSTWIILFLLWPALWLLNRFVKSRPRPGSTPEVATQSLVPMKHLASIILIALYTINLAYGFEDSFKPLGQFNFISRSLSGENLPPQGANRFSQSWLAHIPVPVPANYLKGIDVQRHEFEQGKWSYLGGKQKMGGWWYYYLYAIVVKSPLGTLALLAMASLLIIRRPFNVDWSNELAMLIPGVAILVLVSSQTGFNRYLRYAIPAFPFLYIHISRAAIDLSSSKRAYRTCLAIFILASSLECLLVSPHCMSFFNLAVGGPIGGMRHLVDANIDWGQDLLFLKKWYDNHPDARPLYVWYFGDSSVNPKSAGIEATPTETNKTISPLAPGWHAVSVNHLMGYRHFRDLPSVLTQFQALKPIDQAGYSIYIFHIAPNDSNSQR